MTENRGLHALTAGAVAAMLVAAWAIFLYAPQDALEGPVQRIFYLHVGSALAAFACFAVVLCGSVAYLWRESIRGDRLARAAALVGLVFTTNTFVMGMIWAKPIWNWDPSQTWDARLTSTAVLWVIYSGYLLVRRFAIPGRPAMRLAAVVGIVGFLDVPVVYFSVQWWRTLHPGPVLVTAGGPSSRPRCSSRRPSPPWRCSCSPGPCSRSGTGSRPGATRRRSARWRRSSRPPGRGRDELPRRRLRLRGGPAGRLPGLLAPPAQTALVPVSLADPAVDLRRLRPTALP